MKKADSAEHLEDGDRATGGILSYYYTSTAPNKSAVYEECEYSRGMFAMYICVSTQWGMFAKCYLKRALLQRPSDLTP